MNALEERRQLAEQLHVAAMKSLLQRFRMGRVGVELLQVARLFLADQNVFAAKLGDGEARALKRLQGAYLRQLADAIHRPNPPASLLREVRFLLDARDAALQEALKGSDKGTSEAQAVPFITDPPEGLQ